MAEGAVRQELVEQLLHEIQERADERTPEVVALLLARYDKEAAKDDVCSEHIPLRLSYAKAAIAHHRANKRYKRGHGNFIDVEVAYQAMIQARHAYRDSVFHCGCSDKYDDEVDHNGRKKKIHGRPSSSSHTPL